MIKLLLVHQREIQMLIIKMTVKDNKFYLLLVGTVTINQENMTTLVQVSLVVEVLEAEEIISNLVMELCIDLLIINQLEALIKATQDKVMYGTHKKEWIAK